MIRTGDYLTAIVPLLLIGVLVLLLRWAFGRGHSLVARPARRGAPHDYGLLVPVAMPATEAAGHTLRRQLAEHGITATLASTRAGLRLLVWPRDEQAARRLLDEPD